MDRIVAGQKWQKNEPLDRLAIAQTIAAGFLAQRRESKDTQKQTFSPSSIGGYHGVCPRYWTLAFDGGYFDEKSDAMSVNTMAFGNYAHDQIQGMFKEQGILVSEEQEITIADPPIRGYLDAIVDWHGEHVVCEIKTTRSEAFMFRELSGKPSAQHLLQILIYLKATGLQKGFFLYLNRNDLSICVIPVEMNERNEEIIEEVFEWLRKVRKAWEDNKLPKRPFRKKDNKVCAGCPLQESCWSGPEGDIKIAKMEVPKI